MYKCEGNHTYWGLKKLLRHANKNGSVCHKKEIESETCVNHIAIQ